MSLPARWSPSAEARRVGDARAVRYTPPAIIAPGEAAQLSAWPYTTALYGAFLAEYPWLRGLGVRRASSRWHTEGQRRDTHEEGRAFDLGVNRDDWARGDALADFIVTHASELGVQGVVWRGTEWFSSTYGAAFEDRARADDHDDHLHVELSPDVAIRPASEAMPRLRAAMQGGGGGGGFPLAAVGVGVAVAAVGLWALRRRW